jgi:hypothetical protein
MPDMQLFQPSVSRRVLEVVFQGYLSMPISDLYLREGKNLLERW